MTHVQVVPDSIRPLIERGEIGGRTVQVDEGGLVECVGYEPRALVDGEVRLTTVRSVISSGTELTFHGRDATNVYLHKQWNEELRLFEPGAASMSYPVVIGYRAAGEVIESRAPEVAIGTRVYGNWRHTELLAVPGHVATQQELPDGLSWDDGADIAQMGPICVNAVAFGEGQQAGHAAAVFGAGVVGLITAQLVRVSGADPVHVVDRLPGRLKIAASLGFETLDATEVGDVAASLKRLHGSEGVPVAWECSGSTRALNEAIRLVRRLGTVVAVGFYQGDATGLRLGEEFHHNGVRVVCGQIGNVHPGETWQTLRRRTIEMALAGQVSLGGLPRLTVPVENVVDGIVALQQLPSNVLQVAISYGGVS